MTSMPTKFEQSLAVLTDYFLSDLPPIDENYEFSAKFKKRMEKLIKRYEKPYYMLINTAAKRAACIIVCIIVAISALTLCVRAFLPDVWNMIIEWFDEYVLVGYDADVSVVPKTIEEIRPPKLAIEGIEMSGALRDTELYQTDYLKDETVVCRVMQLPCNKAFKLSDDSFVQTVSIFQFDGIISSTDDHRYLSWEDGEYFYIIVNRNCYLSDEDMIAIAESIYE